MAFDRLGATTEIHAQAGKPTVKIGFFGDLTGENSNLVTSSHNSALLAVKQANAAGNLKYNLEIEAVDNKGGGTDAAPGLAQKLIGDESVVGVIGPAFSGESKVTGELFAKAGLTTVTPSATNPALTENGWKTYFRALATDAVQGGQTGELIGAMNCKTVAIINDKSEYGAGIAAAVSASVKKAGGEVVLEEGIEPTTDYTSVIDSVIPKKPDVLYYGGYVGQAPLVVKQYRDKGGTGLFMGGDGDKGAAFITGGGAAADGAVLTCPCLDPNASDDPKAKKFAKDYKAEYGSEPDIYSAEGWDVAQMYIAAVKAAGSTAPTRESVLKFITDLKDFPGLSKSFTWTDKHEVEAGEITYAYVVKGGKFTLLGKISDLAN